MPFNGQDTETTKYTILLSDYARKLGVHVKEHYLKKISLVGIATKSLGFNSFRITVF